MEQVQYNCFTHKLTTFKITLNYFPQLTYLISPRVQHKPLNPAFICYFRLKNKNEFKTDENYYYAEIISY